MYMTLTLGKATGPCKEPGFFDPKQSGAKFYKLGVDTGTSLRLLTQVIADSVLVFRLSRNVS